MDYQFDTLDLADDSEAGRARNRAWLQAVMHGFHEGRIEDDYEKIWRTHLAADGVVCRGAWLPEGAYGAGPAPVATTSWFDKTLNVGREVLPLRMITDVTASPAHRRRGLVRRLMEDCLERRRRTRASPWRPSTPRRRSTAAGASAWRRSARRSSSTPGSRFGLGRDFTDPGRVELLDPATFRPIVSGQLGLFHRRSRGSVGTPQFYEPLLHRSVGTSTSRARTRNCAAPCTWSA